MDAHGRAQRNLRILSEQPLNAEPLPAALIAGFVTPAERFYIRSHGQIPTLDSDHEVSIGGMVERPHAWTRASLQAGFPAHTVVAVMQCAGNRRGDLQQVGRTSGDPWGVGAIGNAEWTGARLADLLEAAGADRRRAAHVHFLGADQVSVEDETDRFGVSISMAKALHPDTLVAWAMNGESLLPEHGFPLRMVVPGYAGVRSAKWLTEIAASDQPAPQPIQSKDYKLFPASVGKEAVDWSTGLTIEAMPINAAICEPPDRAVIASGAVTVRGYAVAGDRAIARVDVSTNGGRDWQQATLEQRADAPWSWTRWCWTGDLPRGRHELVVRAVDAAGQTQPSQPEHVWNFAGYLATCWHRIHVEVD